ncbi:caspase domain-containing protein [Rhizobium sp. BK068]|nr:caspase domain-containing protein [Rhizobium sp. BK068]
MAVGRGLAKLNTGVGSLIAFSTQPGNVALDGAGRNSPFTTVLLKHLGTPGQSVTDDLVSVRRAVLEATDGKQVPWESSSLTGAVVLDPSRVQDTATRPAAAANTDTSVELAYWNTIKDSTEKGFFEAYLQQYPLGAFAALARLKIDAMDRQAAGRNQVGFNSDAKAEEIAAIEPSGSVVEALPSFFLEPANSSSLGRNGQ